MAFKMKGNPMQRNFGIGSPTNKNGDDELKEMTPKTIAEQRPDYVNPKYPSTTRGDARTLCILYTSPRQREVEESGMPYCA